MAETVRNWLLGISIYPVSYVLTVIIGLLMGGSNIFDPPASYPAWVILLSVDSLLNRCGTGLAQMPIVAWCIILLLLISINAICFVSICSILPRNWKPIALIILYIVLVAINSYKVEINF